MPISLHVLPPAFNLPSIDPECLAAIAYLRSALPCEGWVLVADAANYGKKVSPFLVLGEDCVEGIDAIVEYLRRISNGQWDLDARLSKRERADSFALSSHLVQNFSPLVDLSLYSSPDNYHETVRPAFSAAVGFPESWSIPPGRYTLAQEKVQRLGLKASDLTVLATPESLSSDSGSTRAFEEPSLPHGNPDDNNNPTIAHQLAAKKRLVSQVTISLDPINTLLKSRSEPYLFGDQPSLADCYLLAFSSLALVPELPAPFLANSIRSNFKRLDGYVREGIKHAFGRSVTLEDALVKAPVASDDDDEATFDAYENMEVGSGRTELPWRRPKPRSTAGVVGGLAQRAFLATESALVGA